MTRKICFIVLNFLFVYHLQAQLSTDKHFVYFDFDESVLLDTEKTKLNEVLDLYAGRIAIIELIGHTDSVGSYTYNLQLSEKRVRSVEAYLLQNNLSTSQIRTDYSGETSPLQVNETEEGRQKNRRVELVMYLEKEIEVYVEEAAPPEIVQPPKIVEEIIEYEPYEEEIEEDTIALEKPDPVVRRDTVLEINGAQVLIAVEDYEEFKDCMKIIPILDGEDALEAGLTTVTVDNELLISGGMIKIVLDKSCSEAPKCFKPPLKVRFPIISRTECKPPCTPRNIYRSSGSRWERVKGKRGKKVKTDDESFYEIEIECPAGGTNLDCKSPKYREIKIKVPRKYVIQKLNVISNCPITNYAFEPKKWKAEGHLPCGIDDDRLFVYLTATNGSEAIEVKKIPLDELRHSIRKECKKGGKRWLLFFKKWKSYTFASYKVKESMFEQ